MEDLIPILLQYIKSREKQGGYVLWIAHNGRAFDAPFLIPEFFSCCAERPRNSLFLDTLPLGRELIKSEGILLSLFLKHKHLPLSYENLNSHICFAYYRKKPFFSISCCPSGVLQS